MIAQVMIMLLRGAMLIALVGTLPAAAAASNTEIGMMWFKKQIAWVVAWAAYPLAAAVIYSAAFLLPGQGGLDALLSGVLLLIASVVALPVLIRFLVPMTSTVSGGSGVGQIAAEGAAAAMLMRGLPTGAAQVNEDAAGTADGWRRGRERGRAVGRDGRRRRRRAGWRERGRQRGGWCRRRARPKVPARARRPTGVVVPRAVVRVLLGLRRARVLAVRMGMDGARSVGESGCGRHRRRKFWRRRRGRTGGANGSGGATGANGSYPGDSPGGDGGTATGAAASAGYGESASDGGSGGGPAGASAAAVGGGRAAGAMSRTAAG